MMLNIENLVEVTANGLVTAGLALAISRLPDGLTFTLSTGSPSPGDYLLASGLLAHMGLAMTSWWTSPTSVSNHFPPH